MSRQMCQMSDKRSNRERLEKEGQALYRIESVTKGKHHKEGWN